MSRIASMLRRAGIIFVISAGLQPVYAQTSRTPSDKHAITASEQREQKAFDLAKDHRYKEAAAELRSVPPPSEPKARIQHFRLLAAVHSGLGDRRGAAHEMEKALAITPADSDLAWATSLAEADAGEWQACASHVAPLFAAKPNSRSGLLLLRAQLAGRLEFRATLQEFHGLALPDNQKLELRIRSAELLAAAGEHSEAADEFAEAIKISGQQDENLLYNLAVEQYSSGQYQKALANVQALAQQHDSADVEDLAADIDEQNGNTREAMGHHELAIEMAPNEERYQLSLGAALLKYREYTKATEVFQRAADSFPQSPRIFAGLGMAAYFEEKYDLSVSAFLRADQLDNRSGRALNYLGATQADSAAGPAPAAINEICYRADSHPADPTASNWCSVLRFRRAYFDGDRSAAKEAIPQLRKATALDPSNTVAVCWLGRALAWTEQFTDARHWLEKCVRLRPEMAEGHHQLSRVYAWLGLMQLAAREAAETAKLNAGRQQNDALAERFAHEMLSSGINRQK